MSVMPGSHPGHHIAFSHCVSLGTAPPAFLVFDGSDSFEECWSGVLEDVSDWDLSVIFLTIGSELRVSGRNAAEVNEVPLSSHHVKDISTVSLTFHCAFSPWSPGSAFSTGNVPDFPFLYCVLWRKLLCTTHSLVMGRHALPPPGRSVSINILKFFCMGCLSVLSHFFTYSIVYPNHYFLSYKPILLFFILFFKLLQRGH